MKNFLLSRKIGAVEVLIACVAWSVLFGTRIEVFVALFAGAVFWFSRRKFGGEFTLKDVLSLWENKEREEKS